MLEFREIRKEEWKESIALQAASYMDYDYYTVPFPNEKKRYEFLKVLMPVAVNVFTKDGVQLGCFEDGRLLAAALIAPPEYRPAGLLKYIANGALRVFAAGGIGPSLDWLSMDEEATSTMFRMEGPHWLLESITVSPEGKGQGIGSRMLNECIIPYMKCHGGKKIFLITNSEINCRFYKKNGFKEVEYRTIHCGRKTLGNWTFEKEI